MPAGAEQGAVPFVPKFFRQKRTKRRRNGGRTSFELDFPFGEKIKR